MSDKKLVQYKAYIDKESGSIVCNTLSASNNINLAGQLNLNDMILADSGNGFQLYGNDAQGYPTINFYTGNPGTGLLQYSVGVFNDIWYVIPNGGSQALQVFSDMSVNMPYSVFVCDGNGTFTCDGEATFNSTLTANSANISTTLTANSANISTTLTANSANISTTLTADSANISTTLTADSANISTTLTAQQVICSPATQGAALHIYGDTDYSAELAFMTGSDKLFEIGTTTTNVSTLTGNFFFIYNNQNSTFSMQIITGTIQQINLNGNVNITNTLTATTINATGASISSTLTATTINATGASISSTLTATTINATAINPNNTIVTYSGTTGTAYLSQPFTGQSYKKVVMMFESYTAPTSTVTFTFPVAFESILTEYVAYNPYPLDITLNTGSVLISFDTTATYSTPLIIEGW